MSDVAVSARRASNSGAMEVAARAGLTTRATIYVLMGLIALQVASVGSAQEADQRGALSSVAQHAGGKLVLILLAVGFAGYALWRMSEAVFGAAGEGTDALPRIKSFVRALVYGSFAVSTVQLLAGSGGKSQDSQQQGVTAKALAHTGGQVVVAVVGAVIAVVGLTMVWEGATKKFEKQLRMSEMSSRTRAVVEKLGMVGTIARGLVIALAGGLVVDAAVTSQPAKARGLDGALRTLAHQPNGGVLLGAAALGLIVFGCYGYAEARWHKT